MFDFPDIFRRFSEMSTRRSSRGSRLSEVVQLEEREEAKENTTPTKRRGRPRKTIGGSIPEEEDDLQPTDASPPKRVKVSSRKKKVVEEEEQDSAEPVSVTAIGSLPERERETENLAKYIEDILAENGSGSLYIRLVQGFSFLKGLKLSRTFFVVVRLEREKRQRSPRSLAIAS